MSITDRRGVTVSSTDPAVGADPNPGLAIKAAVLAATTGANIVLAGLQTIDTVALSAGQRVLVKDQTDATTNGIYDAATGNWTRSIDANSNDKVAAGGIVLVFAGAVNAGKFFYLNTPDPILLGETDLAYLVLSTVPLGSLNTTAPLLGGGLLNAGLTLSIAANGITYALMQQATALSIVGRASATAGNLADISTTSGSDAVLRESGGALGFGTVATGGLANNAVTYAKFQQVAASSLVGNATGSLANATGITLGATLAFSGAALQTVALSGDISTSADSFVTAIGANKVLNTMIRQGIARSVIGVAGNATANVADIQGTADQALIVNSAGTALAFGQLNLAAAAAVTGILPSARGGTDNGTFVIGDLLQASAATPALSRLAAVATGNVLISGGIATVSSWGKVGLTTHISGTLAVGNGGTGQTSFTAHGILLGEGSGGFNVTAAMTDGQLLVGQSSADPLPKTVAGDATLAADGTLTIGANKVTYAKFQQVAASSLVGNATGSLANATGITLGATLAFSGAALQTVAHTGDVTTAANSFATTVAKIQGTVVSGTTGSGNVAFSIGAALTSPAISGSPTITGLGTPVASTDAANKAYVDSVAQGLSAKPSAIVATTTTLPGYIYANGSSGVGATITFSATGVVAIDGHNLALNDVVLVKNETSGNAPYNGLYTVTTAPAIGVAGVLTRHTSMDATGEFAGGFVFVEIGTVNGAAGFTCTNSAAVTVGTTAISFTQFSGAGEITVTPELTKTGNQLSVTTNGITYALFQQVAASSLVGNATGSLANATGITLGATLAFSGSALQTAAISGDVTSSANSFATTLAANIVSAAKFRQSMAFSVVGNAGSSTANVADISTTSGSDAVLRESGGALGFGTVATGGLANNAVTYAKFQQVAASSLVGNATGSLANATGITLGATLAFSGAALQTVALSGDVTASANSFVTTIAASAVSNSKMANMADGTIKSNISGGTSAPSDNTLSAILDTLANTQGAILYRGASTWTALGPGTAGQILQTQGASANPIWATGSGGGSSVTDAWVEHGNFGGI
jgi:hypothetical protein